MTEVAVKESRVSDMTRLLLLSLLVALAAARSHNHIKVHGHSDPKTNGQAQSYSVPHLRVGTDECGVADPNRRRSPSQYIVGGDNAAEYEIPWQVQLTYNGNHFCGGSLVQGKTGNFFVISAAHCFQGYTLSKFKARLGVYNKDAAESEVQEFSFSKVTIHPDYNRNTLENDIAVLVMDESSKQVDISARGVYPVCLPVTDPEVGTIVRISGWGTLTEGGSLPSILQVAEKPILSDTECTKAYGSDYSASVMLCAGLLSGGVDSCQGDSGGPMFQADHENRGGRNELYGVVSWGIGCARPGNPGVYTRVTKFLDWIRSIIDG